VRTLLLHVRPHRNALLVAGVLGLVGAAAGLAQPLAAREVIEALAADEPVGRAILFLTALVVAAAFVTALHFWLLERTAQRVVLQARRGLTSRVLRLRMGEIDALAPGDLVSRATSDTTLLGEVASTGLVQSLNGIVSLLGAVVLMAVLDVPLLVVTLLVLVVIGAAVGFVLPRILRATERAQAAVGEMGAVLERALGAIRTVKASGAEAREAEALDRAATHAYREGMRNARYQAVIGTSTGLAIQVSFLAVLGVGGARVAAGSLPVGDLIAFLLYLFYLSEPISGIASGATQLQAGLAAVQRLREVEDLAVETDGVTAAVPADGPLVRFDEVTFRYRDDRPPVLDDVSFTIPARGLVAVVGPSGAGKTTLFALLERFYEPTEGEIAFAGRDLRRGRATSCARRSPTSSRRLRSSPARCARTSCTQRRRPASTRCTPRSPPPGSTASSPLSPRVSTRRSAPAAPRSRAASASAWRSPAPSCARRGCCCSTRRRPSSTPSTRWHCATPWRPRPPSAPSSPSPIASRRSSRRTGSWSSTAAACERSVRTESWWRATSCIASSPPPSSPPD
jgi:ABC-type multidrug transport system fused ATPase/permease subunit